MSHIDSNGIIKIQRNDLECGPVADAHAASGNVLQAVVDVLSPLNVQLEAFWLIGYDGACTVRITVVRHGSSTQQPMCFQLVVTVQSPDTAGASTADSLRTALTSPTIPDDVVAAIKPVLEPLAAPASSSTSAAEFKDAVLNFKAEQKRKEESSPEVIRRNAMMGVRRALETANFESAESAWAACPELRATEESWKVFPAFTLASAAARGGKTDVVKYIIGKLREGEYLPEGVVGDAARGPGHPPGSTSPPLNRQAFELVASALDPAKPFPTGQLAACRHAADLEWLNSRFGPIPAAALTAPFDPKLELYELPTAMSLSELRWRLEHGADMTAIHPQLYGLLATTPQKDPSISPAEHEEMLKLLHASEAPMAGSRGAIVCDPWSGGGQRAEDGESDPCEVAAADPAHKGRPAGGALGREEVGLNYAVTQLSIPLFEHYAALGADPHYNNETPLLAAVSNAFPAPTSGQHVNEATIARAVRAQAMVEHILNNYKPDVNARDGLAVLIAFREAFNWRLVRQFIAAGADVRKRSSEMLWALLRNSAPKWQDIPEQSAAAAPAVADDNTCPTGDWLLDECGADPKAAVAFCKDPYWTLDEAVAVGVPQAWIARRIVPALDAATLTRLGWSPDDDHDA